MIAERGDDRADDLLSAFLDAEVDGERLSHEEILDICFLFLIAGLDTVTASLDCMFTHLAENPEHRQRLIDDPEAIHAIVEELLRWETPVMGGARVATRDTEIDGFDIAEGEQVMVLFGAANVDASETTCPMELDWDREANRHLAFGGGIHRCLGSHLARIELRVALTEWHRRILEISAGEQVMVLFGAANVDAAETACPMELDWDRDANRHLAFGGGIHRCLGSHLARIELRVALTEWHRRIPEYSVAPGAELTFTPGIRTLDRFPMTLGSAAG